MKNYTLIIVENGVNRHAVTFCGAFSDLNVAKDRANMVLNMELSNFWVKGEGVDTILHTSYVSINNLKIEVNILETIVDGDTKMVMYDR